MARYLCRMPLVVPTNVSVIYREPGRKAPLQAVNAIALGVGYRLV
jgi:hypothetical protein